MEHRFNLASDPWIPVYDKNLDQKLVSLRDLLAHSDIYRIDLSDIALMRFIAAAHCLCSMVLRPVERLVFSPKER